MGPEGAASEQERWVWRVLGWVGAWAWWAASGVGGCSGLLRQLGADPEAPWPVCV